MFKYVYVDADLVGEEHSFCGFYSTLLHLDIAGASDTSSVFRTYLFSDTDTMSPRPRACAVCRIAARSLKIKKIRWLKESIEQELIEGW